MDNREPEHTSSELAQDVMEKGNSTVSVLYDTIIEVEGAADEDIFSVLCRRLRQLCNATYAVLASYNDSTRTLTVEAVEGEEENGSQFVQEHPGHTVHLTRELEDNFRLSQVREIVDCSQGVIGLFPAEAFGGTIGSHECRCYDLSCFREGELVATAMVQLDADQMLQMEDGIGAFLDFAGIVIGRLYSAKRLHESEERFRIAAENAVDVIFEWDIVSGEIRWFGKDIGVIDSKWSSFPSTFEAWEKMIHPKDRDRVLNALQRHLKSRERFKVDYRTVESGRSIQHWTSSGKAMWDTNGKPYKMIGTLSEATEQKLTERAIGRAHAELEQIFDNAGGAMRVIDKDFNIMRVNKAFCSLWELGVEEIIGLSCFDVSPSVDCLQSSCPMTRILNGEESVTCDVTILSSSGTEIQCMLTATPLRSPRGEIIGIIEDYNDITERKKAEEVIRAAYKELEKANLEMKEMQSQFIQQEKLASIGLLAAGVAHEMNTPVGFVASNFQSLQSYTMKIKQLLCLYQELLENIGDTENEKLSDYVGRVQRLQEDVNLEFILEDIEGLFNDSKDGLERVTSIIQNLRNFSRIDQMEEFSEFNINDGIKTTLVIVRSEIMDTADLDLQLSEVPLVCTDAGQINQVFLNLLVNASNAIASQKRDDKGTITISTYSEGGFVICEISDDGPGIPKENIGRIFDPFFTTKPPGKGTGLGLSISYDIIVNKHKGRLLVESRAGKGTKFTVKLPIHSGENSGEEENEKSDSFVCG